MGGTYPVMWMEANPTKRTIGLVWPFRRKSALPEIDLGEVELRASQLEITRQYGWQKPAPADDPDELRESLERHEDGLPEPEGNLPAVNGRSAD